MIGALVVAAMLQVPDTIVVRVPVSQPARIIDTVVVDVDVDLTAVADSITRGVMRAQDALNAAIGECDCPTSPPAWFYAGLLSLGAGFLWHYVRSSSNDDADLEDDTAVSTTQAVPTSDAPDPDHWVPPGHRKDRPGRRKGGGTP